MPAKEAREGLQAATLATGSVQVALPVAAAPPRAAAAPLQFVLRVDNAAVIVPINSKCGVFTYSAASGADIPFQCRQTASCLTSALVTLTQFQTTRLSSI